MKTIPSKKVWLVTGASKGIGLALIKVLLAHGHQVAATSRNATLLEKAVSKTTENFLALTVDITTESAVQEAISKIIAQFGRLDVVVNNAGYMLLGSLEEVSASEFQDSFAVNVTGTLNIIRAVMPYLRSQRSGHIINFSSIAGYIGGAESGSYHAAKFAVIGLTEALDQEVSPFGIKATVVAPGLFRTSFLEPEAYVVAKNRIGAYKTDQLASLMQEWNGRQAGDPEKLAQSLLALVEAEHPPVHLLMGPDAYQLFRDARQAELDEIESWKSVTLSTNIN